MNYSQSTEQEFILKFFGDFKGTFLDLGCNDGVTFSNTYALAFEHGWDGTLVDASPTAYKKVDALYHHSTRHDVWNYAIAAKEGMVDLHESGSLLGTGDTALVSSTKLEEVARWDSLKIPFETIQVPAITFADLMAASLYKKYDFISIDIEGGELDILPQIDLKALETKLICVEFNGKNKEQYDAIIVAQGFELIHTNAENLIYAAKK